MFTNKENQKARQQNEADIKERTQAAQGRTQSDFLDFEKHVSRDGAKDGT